LWKRVGLHQTEFQKNITPFSKKSLAYYPKKSQISSPVAKVGLGPPLNAPAAQLHQTRTLGALLPP
jgi:hypothetical protein